MPLSDYVLRACPTCDGHGSLMVCSECRKPQDEHRYACPVADREYEWDQNIIGVLEIGPKTLEQFGQLFSIEPAREALERLVKTGYVVGPSTIGGLYGLADDDDYGDDDDDGA